MSKKTQQSVQDRFAKIVSSEDQEGFPTLEPEKIRPKTTRRMVNALQIPIDSINPDPHQPRKKFGDMALEELANSIKEHGVMQPITVTRADNPDQYTIIAGERRYRAAVQAGLTEMPCILQDGVDDAGKTAKQLIENIQREDLSPVEKADGLLQLKERLGGSATWAEVEKLTGFGRRRRQQLLAVKKLPAVIQEEIVTLGTKRDKNNITEGHARALLRLPTEKQQLSLFERIKQEALTSEQAMKTAQSMMIKKPKKAGPVKKRLVITYESDTDLIEQLRAKLAELEAFLE